MKNIFLPFLLILLAFSFTATAQEGYSSGSVSMNRANGVFSPDQVVVEEYINYHRHNITMPKSKENIALSIDYLAISDKNLVVQIGIATQRLLDYSSMQPINISLVIDVSGSMQSDNKLEKVKKALKNFIKGLRPEDYISLVTYDSEARVVLQSQKVGELHNLESIIKGLETAGSTNLYDGMVLGYEQVKIHFNPNHTNKVILLTDGVANVGITDVEKIVEKSYSYNKEGIYISTVGVGTDLNYSLLQQIAKEGKGANHFVGDAEEDIIKVFDVELESLLSPIAKQVYLEINFPSTFKLTNVFGYSPEYKQNSIKILLKNINSGLTQIILCEFEVIDPKKSSLEANLNYFSYADNASKQLTEKLTIITKNSTQLDKSDEVTKNYYIAKMATSLKDMAEAVKDEDYKKGKLVLENCLQEVDNRFPHLRDKDILRVKEIVVDNKNKLEEYMRLSKSE